MNLLRNAIAYSSDGDSQVVGKIVGVNTVENTMTLKLEDGKFTEVRKADSVVMHEIGMLNGQLVYENDIYGVQGSSVQYIFKRHGNERISLSIVDNDLNVTKFVEAIFPIELAKYSNVLELVENKYTLIIRKNELEKKQAEEDKKKDFNIKIVKTNGSIGHFEYFYVGNNKKENTVDLIKVIYMGHQLLKEESYERTEISMDEFLHILEKGYYTEVSPQELTNYVMGMLSFVNQVDIKVDDCSDENICDNCDCGRDEEESEFCKICDEEIDECECPNI